GTLKVHVKYKGRNFYVQTVVVDVEITPLLGRDWLNVINPAWKNQVLHVTEDKLTLDGILEAHKRIFDTDRIGQYTPTKVKLYLKEGSTPKFMRHRNMPYSQRETVE